MGGNNGFNRIDELCLRSESPRIFGSSTEQVVPSPSRNLPVYDKQPTRQLPPSSPTNSSRSSESRSSASSRIYSGASVASRGRQSSISSFPSVDAAPPWQPLQTLAMALDYEYDLPCEFTFSGCHLRFHSGAFEEWINHSVSHFGGHAPPVRSVCTFCDDEFDGPNNAERTWRHRMIHIGRHFYDRRADGVEMNHPRPDFWVLDHLKLIRLISPKDYFEANQYSERPTCDNTHPHGWRPQEMVYREERSSGISHDLRKEKHQRKKEKEKRSGKTHRHH